MSLQIWLPFTKDDSNYGILNMNPTSNTGKKVNSDHWGGYEFNSDVNELLSDNVFQQVLTVRDSSKYYRSYFNGNKEGD